MCFFFFYVLLSSNTRNVFVFLFLCALSFNVSFFVFLWASRTQLFSALLDLFSAIVEKHSGSDHFVSNMTKLDFFDTKF